MTEQFLERCKIDTKEIACRDQVIEDELAREIEIHMRENSDIESVNFEVTRLYDNAAQFLANGIKYSKSLKFINFWGAKPYAYQVKPIAWAIGQNPSIESFSFKQTHIGNDAVIFLAQAIQINPSIKKAVLSGCDMGDIAALEIAKSIKNSASLIEIHLQWNGIGNMGVCAIGSALKASSLKMIDLSGNSFDDKGLFCLAEAVRENTSITSLIIAKNTFAHRMWEDCQASYEGEQRFSVVEEKTKGLDALARAVGDSKVIEHLNLSGTALYDKGLKIIIEGIKGSIALRKLLLFHNKLSDESATSIADLILTSSSLEVLCIGHNPISYKGIMIIAKSICLLELSHFICADTICCKGGPKHKSESPNLSGKSFGGLFR